MHEQCYDIDFINNKIIISKFSTSTCCAKRDNGLYVLKPSEQTILNNELFRVANPQHNNKRQKVSKDDETYL